MKKGPFTDNYWRDFIVYHGLIASFGLILGLPIGFLFSWLGGIFFIVLFFLGAAIATLGNWYIDKSLDRI